MSVFSLFPEKCTFLFSENQDLQNLLGSTLCTGCACREGCLPEYSLSGKARILVTHALHFLPQVDYIYVISDGRIAEQGTYAKLMARGGEFSAFIKEFGSTAQGKMGDEDEEVAIKNSDIETECSKVDSAAGLTREKEKLEEMKKATSGAAIMQTEERNTGAIQWGVYQTFIKAGYGEVMIPLLVLSLVLLQGATVLSSYWYAILFLFWFHVD